MPQVLSERGLFEPGHVVLARLAARWAHHGPPVIVFNKSHSGSRLLTRLLIENGVFMGAERNDSEDSADMLRLVEPLVERHYPDYARLMRDGDPDLEPLVDSVLERHLMRRGNARQWGWKLCETGYILPVLARIFPQARFVHLLRDGRDVAFSDHVAPTLPFWRKVYFDTDRIESWQGRGLDHRSYLKAPHLFNARHWVNSVTAARHYGSMIGERYIELRYEDLVLRPVETARRLLDELGIPVDADGMARWSLTVNHSAIGKHRRMRRESCAKALAILSPTLASFGYGEGETEDTVKRRPRRLWRWSGG